MDDLVRISAGVEDIEDLLQDLDGAMQLAMKAAGMEPKSYLDAAGAKGASEREFALEQRVKHLEARLAAAEGK